MPFLDDHYLLSGDTAAHLYAEVADLPIIDPHNHADVREICEDRNYTDIWQVEAATDHYVWSALRKRGVPENLITGSAPNRDKWLALAAVFDELIGNPTYEWIHLDLKRRLGIDHLLGAATGAAIWDATLRVLQQPDMRPQALLHAMKVEHICSTDDPVDRLEYHQRLAAANLPTQVHPTFRPDKAMNIFKPDWRDYVTRLEARVGSPFRSVADLIAGLRVTHDYFAAHGCLASDHGVHTPCGYQVDAAEADTVFRKARDGRRLERAETVAFMSYVLNEVAEMDAAKGWVFQLHLGCVRDVRDTLARSIGPDSGGDISDHTIDIVTPLLPFLNRFDGRLKTVLYALDPAHQPSLATLSRGFGADVSLGSAWWFNDTPVGMRRQLEYIGSVDMLMNFAGMVSDSRKLLAYGSRHEMFRRVLCDVVGTMVDRGQMPAHLAERLVCHLAYERPKHLFGFR